MVRLLFRCATPELAFLKRRRIVSLIGFIRWMARQRASMAGWGWDWQFAERLSKHTAGASGSKAPRMREQLFTLHYLAFSQIVDCCKADSQVFGNSPGKS